MKQPIVAIEDAFEGFYQPRRCANIEGAIRDFRVLCIDNPKAEDLKLWHLGEMDTDTGEITPKKPELLEKGVKHVQKSLDD